MVRRIAQKEKEQKDGEEEEEDGDEEEEEGARDSLVAQKLIKEQQEESGRVRRSIASRFVSFLTCYLCLCLDFDGTLRFDCLIF